MFTKACDSSAKLWIVLVDKDENHNKAAFSKKVENVLQRIELLALLTNIIDLNMVIWSWRSPVPSYDFNVFGN